MASNTKSNDPGKPRWVEPVALSQGHPQTPEGIEVFVQDHGVSVTEREASNASPLKAARSSREAFFKRPDELLDSPVIASAFTFGPPLRLNPSYTTVSGFKSKPQPLYSSRKLIENQVVGTTEDFDTQLPVLSPGLVVDSVPVVSQAADQHTDRNSTLDGVPAETAACLSVAVGDGPDKQSGSSIQQRPSQTSPGSGGKTTKGTVSDEAKEGLLHGDLTVPNSPRQTHSASSPVSDLSFTVKDLPSKNRTGGHGKVKKASPHSVGRFHTHTRPSTVRSSSHVSNISKRRTPNRPLPLSQITAHTPSSDRMPISADIYTAADLRIFAEEFLGSYNHIFQEGQKKRDEIEAKIARLYDKIKLQASEIKERDSLVTAQDSEIKSLQGEKKRLSNQVATLESSKSRLQQLEEKLRIHKGHLNAAMKERHELFRKSRAACQQTLAEIRSEKHAQELRREDINKTSEAARIRLMGSVKAAINESRKQAEEQSRRIEDLEEKIRHRDVQLTQEKQLSESLLRQAEARQHVDTCLQSLALQSTDILKKLVNISDDVKTATDECTATQGRSAERIMGRLDTITHEIPCQAEILSNIERLHGEISSKLISEITPTIDAQKSTEGLISQMSLELRSQAETVWRHLEDRESLWNEQLIEKREENAFLSTLVQEKEMECQNLTESLTDAANNTSRLEGINSALQTNVNDLKKELQDDRLALGRLHDLESEFENLKKNVLDKEQTIASLKKEMQERDDLHSTKTQELGQEVHDLTQKLDTFRMNAESQLQSGIEDDRRRQQENFETETASLRQQHIKSEQGRLAAEKKLESASTEHLAEIQDLQMQLTERKAREKQASQVVHTRRKELSTLANNLLRWLHDHPDLLQGLKVESQGLSDNSSEVLRTSGESAGSVPIRQVLSALFSQLSIQDASLAKIDHDKRTAEASSQGHAIQSQPKGGDLGTSSSDLRSVSLSPKPEAGESLPDRGSLSQTLSQQPVSYERTRARKRRVLLRSPPDDESIREPLSIEQEKDRRRSGFQPRSIMKPTPIQDSNTSDKGIPPLPDLVKKTVLNSEKSVFSRGQYNRPVMGAGPQPVDAGRCTHGEAKKDSNTKQSLSAFADESRKRIASAGEGDPGSGSRTSSKRRKSSPEEPICEAAKLHAGKRNGKPRSLKGPFIFRQKEASTDGTAQRS
ncbi:uncharacterized protein E0L32_001443 [Thyridium curvatum]|uniref:Uncharacterized protein n=1 Tax=Thyridium curvatum TaxID=1093900 RepID=A0A507AU62_9PEZI|nr:uncharacterized protein E0L32_001443 [Thyridium curvatum]TPX10246.1 hypothetical protein E0L32_001443 [Thyridium curvatum]